MSHDNPNQCGYYEQETVPCDLCGTPTPMTGTRRCDPCWELERRVEQRPEVAKKLVAAMDAIDANAATQLITRLTEALARIRNKVDGAILAGYQNTSSYVTELRDIDGEAAQALATVAKG